MSSSLSFVLLTILICNLALLVSTGDYPVTGVVLLQSAPRSEAFGTATITQQFEGGPVIIEGLIFNLRPNSLFGLHVHERGDLTNACDSTGAHFNPYEKQHGSERSPDRHWGDFSNIASDNTGNARISINVPEGSLIGIDGYLGRALVLHEREDDLGLTDHELSKKTGNSGGRIACGVIGIRQPIDRLPIGQRQWNNNGQRTSNFQSAFRQPLRTM